MSYITRNANLLLLFLIVLIASSLVGATVYFQNRFDNINEQYDTKLAELKNLTEQAENYRSVLQKAQLELELKQSREEQFTEKYTEARATSEQLAQTKTELEQSVADLTAQVNAKSAQVVSLSNQVTQLDRDLKLEKSDNAELRGDVLALQDEVDCLKDTTDSMENNC